MSTIIFLIIGIAAGAAIGWFASTTKSGKHIDSIKTGLAEKEAEIKMLRREIELTAEQKLRDEEQRRRDEEQRRRDDEQKRKDDDAREKHYAEQLRASQEQLKNATSDLLKLRAEELNKSNSSQMNAIIEPLKEKIKEMQQAMESTREMNTRNTASLQQAIEDVIKRTASIGDEAGKLAKALRHENKIQGNWGETILNELLESQGLKQGIHYEVQATIKDKNGRPVLNENTDKRMVPDVILNYSKGKSLIIDSKVSLSAFLDYTAAETEEQKKEALDRHIKSIRSHVKELANKNYKRYILPPRESLNFMIMFVPNESALQLAIINDSSLWREALGMGVFIAGEYNLVATLRIVELAWIQEVQAEQQRKVSELATQLIERVGEFYSHFRLIRERMESVNKAYSDAEKKLMTGRQNMLSPAQKLKEMGYKEKEKYPLPESNESAGILIE